jgi:hypothetical protein
MHLCPHCRQRAVPARAVRWSSREAPARCGHCQRLCHALGSSANGILAVHVVLFTVAVIAGMVLQSWLAGLAMVALIPLYNRWAWRDIELFPISEESARNAKVAWWIVAFGAVARFFMH